jgi:fructose-1,6-bisphosphatase/inositol monophosphatase family enzyme
VIVREAGGTVSELSGGDIGLRSTTILASNGALHAPMLEAMRQ